MQTTTETKQAEGDTCYDKSEREVYFTKGTLFLVITQKGSVEYNTRPTHFGEAFEKADLLLARPVRRVKRAESSELDASPKLLLVIVKKT